MALRLTALVVAILAAAPAGATEGAQPFPRPSALGPNVWFWTRIFSEVDTRSGLLHDSEQLDVVYEVVRLPAPAGTRASERHLDRRRERVIAALRTLAGGKREHLSTLERRVLARWPEGTSDATFRAATGRVRFQLGQADKFQAGIVRSGAWEKSIRTILTESGLPTELAALPHVESSYNPTAVSHAGAAGLWQFTRSTGRRFLRIDHVVDERFDPYRASEAAARLLLENHAKTGNWPLAITAYNHGAAGMLRAVRETGTDDIAAIVRSYRGRTFGFASRNFYAEFLAALDVERDAQRYFGDLPRDPELQLEEVELDHYYAVTTLGDTFGLPLDLLRRHNPALLGPVWRGQKHVPRGFRLRVPLRAGEETGPHLALSRIPASQRFAEQRPDRTYHVKRGDTLSDIARRFGVSQRELASLNGLRSRHRIRVGQRLRIPVHDPLGAVARGPAAPDGSHFLHAIPADGRYRVRPGDTLSLVGQRFGIRQADLARWNRLADAHHIQVGQALWLRPPPAREEDAARVASAPPAEDDALPLPSAPTFEASRFAVRADARVEVQPGETLGLLADWLGVSNATLEALNSLRASAPLAVGSRLQLDFSRRSREDFEHQRIAFHRQRHEAFFRSHRVAGTSDYVLRKGDTLWALTKRRYDVPLWLLHHYNPELDLNAVRPGTRIIIPQVEPRAG